jgi:hypothetical protein
MFAAGRKLTVIDGADCQSRSDASETDFEGQPGDVQNP